MNNEEKYKRLASRLSPEPWKDVEGSIYADYNLLRECMSVLDPRETEITRQYWGLDSAEDPMTLDQIANQWGLTRERIRQLKERSIGKLKEEYELRLD